MTDWFLEPARLWLLLVVVGLVAVYVIVQFTRPRYAVRFSNLELLDKVAPKRPGWRRHLAAGFFEDVVSERTGETYERPTKTPYYLRHIYAAWALAADADRSSPSGSFDKRLRPNYLAEGG